MSSYENVLHYNQTSAQLIKEFNKIGLVAFLEKWRSDDDWVTFFQYRNLPKMAAVWLGRRMLDK